MIISMDGYTRDLWLQVLHSEINKNFMNALSNRTPRSSDRYSCFVSGTPASYPVLLLCIRYSCFVLSTPASYPVLLLRTQYSCFVSGTPASYPEGPILVDILTELNRCPKFLQQN
jgi:hypothetical protein